MVARPLLSAGTFAINAAFLTAVMLAVDLLTWTQTILLHDQPALTRALLRTASTRWSNA